MSLEDHLAWAPKEPADILMTERAMLAGFLVSGVAYGINVSIFLITLNLLWKRRRETWKDYIWITYIVFMFSLASIGNGTQFKYAELAFINYRNYPGGPAVFDAEAAPETVGIVCNSIYIMSTFFQDGLLLYRFMVICGTNIVILAFPCLLYLGTMGLGFTMIVIQATRGATLSSNVIHPLLTSYFSVSIGLNIILTCAIVVRLLAARRRLSSISGAPYVSVAAMLIESAFLYSAAAIAYLVTSGLQNRGQEVVLPVLAQLQSVAPLLIIMRVAQGQAWSRETAASAGPSSLYFPGSRRQAQVTSTGYGSGVAASATQIATFEREKSSDSLYRKSASV